ncbi:MAG: sugar phosphate nucleotidyltransferase, partial [Angustibacter sp.]
ISPSFPATGFGYIRAGESLSLAQAPAARAVQEFVEKPSAPVAAEYLAAGYRWNAGIFVARAATIMQLLGDYRPQLAADLWRIAVAWDSPGRADVLEELWPHLERVAVDYAIAEPAAADGRVAMVPGDFGWDDVGDFAALSGTLPPAPVQTLGSAQVLAVRSTGLVIGERERLIAVLGVEDIVVVDTPDALLVTTRAHAQSVKSIVEALGERPDLL